MEIKKSYPTNTPVPVLILYEIIFILTVCKKTPKKTKNSSTEGTCDNATENTIN